MNSPVRKIVASPVKKPKISPLAKQLEMAKAKIRADLFRFRTCCADPRASK